MMSTSSMHAAPPAMSNGSMGGTPRGTGAAYWRAVSEASWKASSSRSHASPIGTSEPVR